MGQDETQNVNVADSNIDSQYIVRLYPNRSSNIPEATEYGETDCLPCWRKHNGAKDIQVQTWTNYATISEGHVLYASYFTFVLSGSESRPSTSHLWQKLFALCPYKQLYIWSREFRAHWHGQVVQVYTSR